MLVGEKGEGRRGRRPCGGGGRRGQCRICVGEMPAKWTFRMNVAKKLDWLMEYSSKRLSIQLADLKSFQPFRISLIRISAIHAWYTEGYHDERALCRDFISENISNLYNNDMNISCG